MEKAEGYAKLGGRNQTEVVESLKNSEYIQINLEGMVGFHSLLSYFYLYTSDSISWRRAYSLAVEARILQFLL